MIIVYAKKGKIVNVDNNDAQFSKYQENINAKNYLKLAEPFEFSEFDLVGTCPIHELAFFIKINILFLKYYI